MDRRKLIIWGASGHAMVAADIVKLTSQYEVAGFLDDVKEERRDQTFCGGFIRGGQEQLSILKEEARWLFVAVGDCEARLALAAVAKQHGFELATLVHPRAVVAADVKIDEGSLIGPGAVICPGACIGQNVIVNTSATVDHECLIEDGVHVSPGAHLAGNVKVGRATWVGLGTNVKEGVRLGSHSVIGAGSLVLHDIPDNALAYGVPARLIARTGRFEATS